MFRDKKALASALALAAGIVVFLWGVAHIIPTPVVVSDFGTISDENVTIITMEWVAEGLTLCFIGALLMVLYPDVRKGERVARKVGIFLALVLFVFAVWTALTGAGTSIVPIKICPFVKTVCGLLVLVPLLLYRKEWAS